jgi:pantothenate kinase
MSAIQETVVTVPAVLARSCKGLALDFGSSTHKYVYRTKEQADEVSSEDAKYGHLHLVSFPRSQLTEALEYVRQRADITRSGDEPTTVYTTGVGCTEYRKIICEKLDIKLEQLTEFDCFVKSFIYLAKRLPRTELLHPYLEEATIEPLEFAKSQMAAMQQLTDENQTNVLSIDTAGFLQGLEFALGRPSAAALTAGDVPLYEAEPDMFPCILAMCGSGFGFMKIEKDGSVKMVDLSYRGGKAFFGVGCLLTGCKTFSELTDLAANGTQRNVDTFSDELVADFTDVAVDEDNLYTKSKHTTPGLLYCFGKACGTNLADLKREDVARAWLNYVVLDLVQCAQNACIQNGVTRLFFCGGFCDHPLIRSLITTEYVRRNLLRMALGVTAVSMFDFVKPGAHLGALGCVVNSLEK